MRKFLQWSLVTLVAVALMAVVANQMLSSSTGRARDASVAVLKDKLAKLEAARPPIVEEMERGTAKDAAGDSPTPLDLATLRERWKTLLLSSQNLYETCSMARGSAVSVKIFRSILDLEDATLTEDELEKLRAYQECMQATMEEILFLCGHRVAPREFYGPEFRPESSGALYGFSWVSWQLRAYTEEQAYGVDYTAAVEGIRANVELSRLFASVADRDMTGPKIIQDALKSGAVDEATWLRLLDSLASRRDQDLFAALVEKRSQGMLRMYENWPQSVEFTFTEMPLHYSQNWAYRHITTPMFNRDLEKFGKAMDVLLDLSALPYYEAKPALEQFYVDFDVEESPENIKVIRGNPAWRYVLELSRVYFPGEADYQTSLDLTRIAILLERHKQKAGSYPESLEALAGELGGTVLLCPVDGAPYEYRREDETYWLAGRIHEEPEAMKKYNLPAIALRPWFVDMKNAKPAGTEP